MILRDYQRTAVEQVRESLRLGKRPCLVSPTGSGKTEMSIACVEGMSVLWVAHRRELIQQAADRLARVGRSAHILCGDMDSGPGDGGTFVASIQTLARRKIPATDVIWVDELHHFPSKSYRKLDRESRIGGCTATPFRLDGRGLAPFFNDMIVAAYPDDLIRDGFLVMPRMYAPDIPDLSGVATLKGDYDLSSISKIMSESKLIGSIVDHWRELAGGTRTLVYAVDVAHAETIVEAFGPLARVVTAKTPDEDRAEMFADLADGRLLVLVNVGIATEGTDIPSLETIIVARPTASLALHLQICGRVMRPFGGKSATLIDHAGNLIRHGPPDQRVQYTLEGRTKRKGIETGLKRCPECLSLVAANCLTCAYCGHTFDSISRELDKRDGRLIELMSMDDRYQLWRDLVEERQMEGHSPTWAVIKYFFKIGRFPDPWSVPFADSQKPVHRLKKAMWDEIVKVQKRRNYSIGWASHQYKSVFGVWPVGVKSDDQKRPRPVGVS